VFRYFFPEETRHLQFIIIITLPYYEDSPPKKRKTSTLYYGIAKFDFFFPFFFLMVSLLASSQNSEKKGKKNTGCGLVLSLHGKHKKKKTTTTTTTTLWSAFETRRRKWRSWKAGFLLSMNQTRRSFVDEALSKKNWVFSLKQQVSVVN
jgi:hypothetical protein